MARIHFHPYNDEGELVKRGMNSMRALATKEEVVDKLLYTARRDGIGRIVHIEVLNDGREMLSAWDVRANGLVQTDGIGSETMEAAYIPADIQMKEFSMPPTADEVAAREAAEKKPAAPNGEDAAKLKAKAKADAEAKKAEEKKAKEEAKAKKAAEKGPTKKQTVLDMLRSKDKDNKPAGTTIDDIVKKLNITNQAARALIGDCQRMDGVTVRRDKVDNVSRYYA